MANIENLIHQLSQENTAIKIAPHPLRLSLQWMAWGVGYLAISLLISGVRPDIVPKLQEPLFLAEIITLITMFISASISAAILAFPDLHQLRKAAWLPLLAFITLWAVLFFAWYSTISPVPLPQHSFECCLSIMLLAVLPAIWIFFEMRKIASTHPSASGIAAMQAAFSIGALWIRLYEQTDSIIHVIEWHYLPMLGFAALGAWLGKRLLKW